MLDKGQQTIYHTELLLKGTKYVKWLTLILFNFIQNFSFNPTEVIKSFSHIHVTLKYINCS